jgi:glycolate oxidase iron-sulfur subunit
MEALLPPLPTRPLHRAVDVVSPANGEPKYRVGFFLGCMMSTLFAEASRATLQVLTQAGCEVITPRNQLCCGAPQDDQGNRAKLRQFARQNIRLFEQMGDLDVIVSDCAACSGMLKEYGDLLQDDPHFADRAAAFSARVQDIYEWYDRILPATLGPNGLEPTPVTIHDACHLANAQGIRRPQRRVLDRLQSVRIVEMAEPSACCGSAGIYNITHPEMAEKRLARKMANIEATNAPVVVTTGPGCLLQLRAAAGNHSAGIQIRHISQLVAQAMQEESP